MFRLTCVSHSWFIVMILSLLVSLSLVPLCFCESHYSVLGVSKHAESKEIKQAYDKLAQKWVDKDPSAPEMMEKINRAYKVLSDPEKKRHYDLNRDSGSSQKPSSTAEPSYKINTETFMNNVLPDSITAPYLIYFYHDYSFQCENWTKLVTDMKNDFQTIGVKMAAVDVIINSNVSTYCGIYIHEVPKMVLLLNKKTYIFRDMLSLDNLKEFIYTKLPSRNAKHIDDLNNVLSVKTRIINNKPSVLLISPRIDSTLNYKIISFTYRMYMDFHFVSSTSKSNVGLITYLNLTEEDKHLYVYSDLNEPVTVLKGDDLNRKTTIIALEKHKFLTLPRVNSCNMLDTLCPGGRNTRWCVLLVSDIGDNVIDEFRHLANKWSSRKFNMGYLNKNQSTLMDAGKETVHLCDNEEPSRSILLLHRLTIHKLEYRWYNGYCGTGDDNTRLLKIIKEKQSNEITTMDECIFYSKTVNVTIPTKPPFEVDAVFSILYAMVDFILYFTAVLFDIIIYVSFVLFNVFLFILEFVWQHNHLTFCGIGLIILCLLFQYLQSGPHHYDGNENNTSNTDLQSDSNTPEEPSIQYDSTTGIFKHNERMTNFVSNPHPNRFGWRKRNSVKKPSEGKTQQPTMKLAIGRFNYSIDFTAKTQTNLTTGKIRKIKHASSTGGKWYWYFQNDLLQFQSYERYSAQLEKRYQSSTTTISGVHTTKIEGINISEVEPDIHVPKYWETQTETFAKFKVQKNSNEWNDVAGKFMQTMKGKAKITCIECIQNQEIWDRYFEEKQRLQKDNNVINEEQLFHGTSSNDPSGIYNRKEGFDIEHSESGMWGRANYFAVNASYSDGYAHTCMYSGQKMMLMAWVLTGDSFECQPDNTLRRPPEKSNSSELYDSVIGNTGGSKVYMTYDNSKAYPTYLIKLYRVSLKIHDIVLITIKLYSLVNVLYSLTNVLYIFIVNLLL